MPKAKPKPRVAVGPDVVSSEALTARAVLVGKMAPATTFYTTIPAYKSLIDDFVAAGVAQAAAEDKVTSLEAQLTNARTDRDAARVVTLAAHGAAVKQVQKVSSTASDIEASGFVYLDLVKQGLVLPSALLATYNTAKAMIHLHVRYSSRGDHKCVIEVSPSPVTPTSFVRLEGTGVVRDLPGYAPGTWWVHAATQDSQGRSDWFGPVAVVVK